MAKTTFTRQELYDLVWSEPRSVLAKRFNISDVEIAKACKKMNSPMPSSGYWSKIRFGKPVTKASLPNIYDGNNEVSLDELCSDSSLTNSDNTRTKLMSEIESDPKLPLRISKTLKNPDILIQNVQEFYKNHTRCYNEPIIRLLKIYGVLNVDVSKNFLPRALLLMDAIIKLLRARGHDVIIKHGNTYAIVYGEEIYIRLKEKYRFGNEVNRNGPREYISTGVLSLMYESNYSPNEIKIASDPLETKLSTILERLETRAEYLKKQRLDWEKEKAEQEEKERIIREIRSRQVNNQ